MATNRGRLIPLMTAAGAVQMAVDEWLLEQHRQGKQPPILRFYTWEPIALSLGFHQHSIPAHWHHLTWQNQPVELVRRPSGGRAVLHQGDLTYAVIRSDLPQQRRQSYQQICQFLLQGWRSLGIELNYGETGRGYIHQPNCFGSATTADLVMTDGTKLIGSAQLRRGTAVLQHGSMRLQPDPILHQQVFGAPVSLPCLPWQSCVSGMIEPIMAALIAAASQCFDLTWNLQPLSDEEWAAIRAFQPAGSPSASHRPSPPVEETLTDALPG